MFPVSDVIPSRSRPVVTVALVFLIAAAFTWQLQLDDFGVQVLLDEYGVTSNAFSPVRLVVGLFLHAGWIHVLVNVLYLWLFGPNLEDAFGSIWLLLFYVTAGALAALVQVVAHPAFSDPLVGGSGAVAAVLGAYLVLYPQSRVLTLFFAIRHIDLIEIPALAYLGLWFVLQLASDIWTFRVPLTAGAPAFWSHLAGFAIGVICGAYARWGTRVLRTYWIREDRR
jgi:membrane associated rhomboid family serine protease